MKCLLDFPLRWEMLASCATVQRCDWLRPAVKRAWKTVRLPPSDLRMRTLLARAARQPLGMNLIGGTSSEVARRTKGRDVKKHGRDGLGVKLTYT